MCLDMIEEEEVELKPDGIGYKVYYTGKGNIKNALQAYPDNSYVIGKEYTALQPHRSLYYKCGFHIFKQLADAKDRCSFWNPGFSIFKVKYSNAHTFGYQWGMPIIVADKITILEKVTELD